MHRSLFGVLALFSLGSASHPAVRPTRAGCVDLRLPIRASATNFDLDVTPARRTERITGTFLMQFVFCEPTVRNSSRADTLLVLSPGSTYNTMYWDMPFQPETYSFVRRASASGFATLNVARLGDGKSEHPADPEIVQLPLQSALLVELVRLARAGTLVPGKRFRTVVGIGHSLSSGMFNDVMLTAPDVLDGVVLSGYAHVSNGQPLAVIPGFFPARTILPARFGGLADGYLTSDNITTRSGFYGPAGTFDPAVLQFDEGHKDLVTVAELASFGIDEVPAPDFKGPVLAVNGNFDRSFCPAPLCANLLNEPAFYPKAKSVETSAYATIYFGCPSTDYNYCAS
ncbi:hypothetical protein EXIGLDRAFT_622169 [Exidia glandulosa HHB12029]|uniref:AB hydrolase-1 domain-containing protein n=1 Tax=Exidia glandulosa HHB12029 TaxID=1314781 RepID=A0A165E828_EXIGL|nr:hypothetical protein EXIGLDRAFT_622169 [Exidia glandulosa HHB12029]